MSVAAEPAGDDIVLNDTIHQATRLQITKEFHGSKPRTWVQSTPSGRRAFADYLSNLQRALNFQPPQPPSSHWTDTQGRQPAGTPERYTSWLDGNS